MNLSWISAAERKNCSRGREKNFSAGKFVLNVLYDHFITISCGKSRKNTCRCYVASDLVLKSLTLRQTPLRVRATDRLDRASEFSPTVWCRASPNIIRVC